MAEKNNPYFGALNFTPRERAILRLERLRSLIGERIMRARYRDRVDFGPGCRIDYKTMAVMGLGAVRLGECVVIDRGIGRVLFHLERGAETRIGAHTWFQTFDADTIFSCKEGARIELGERCWFSGGLFGASREIIVGDHTLIGWGCMILDSNMHRPDNDAPPVEPEPVRIGSHVWMPSNVTVLKGVTIGDHSVIGTGSLVLDDIPDHSFAAGRPARVIRRIGDRDRVE